MKVVVTGGAGFIGSHLVDRLVADQAGEIIIFDNLFRGRRENISAHRDNRYVQFVQSDIRDPYSLEEIFQGVEVVFHLAAQSNVMGAVTDVDYSFSSNVVGTYNVLKAAKKAGVRRVVFTSSREAYGEPRYLPVDEDHPIGSKNAYGASKVAGEMYCRVFQNQYDLDIAVLRLSNVYGPRDFGRVIPLWLDRAKEGKDLVVYGGQQVIDFVWIDQVIEALVRASTYDLRGSPVNVGSGQGTAILELAQRILQVARASSKLDLQPARSAEVVKFTADIRRMKDVLGLEPPVDPLFALESMVL